jgi:hypothetical protein
MEIFSNLSGLSKYITHLARIFLDNGIMLNEGPLTFIKWKVSMGEISKGRVEKLDPNKALNLKYKWGLIEAIDFQ